MTLAVEVNDPSFTKLNDAQVTATITPPSSKATEMPLQWAVKKDGIYRGRLSARGEGHLSGPGDGSAARKGSRESRNGFSP